MGLINRIQAKLELFRLEQRYTNRKNRRTAFSSDAIYVDGEYVYASSNTTGSSSRSDQSMGSAATRSATPSTAFDSASATAKAAKRRSMMVFSGESAADIETRVEAGNEMGAPQRRWSRNWGKNRAEEKRRSMAVVREARWEDGQ
ncbi:hypothetical protein VC83_07272 [Pseudogymnoascus destructans]|uniref:Uncharacterized protein n=2 Tax=Pseudogymnoascus destructans TaxID=655981 RepID=L8FYE8_PSED2|nr:uncharacterized protein VC83_07272 [Pseudogymnoascus destructans]ELR05503.1 hypothetical protein GMDG_07425 [Pseudogymnoascus destructans 20631-21]OAF56713.1 hypothetical protein VC83_07272 [Pseudogymnoascus destructans]